MTSITHDMSAESDSRIEIHKKIAGHLMASATHHLKAAFHLQEKNNDKYAQHVVLAQEYLNLASEAKIQN
jgi:hypothetical protein